MDTLYCFRFNRENGQLNRFEITDYEVVELSPYTHRRAFKFKANFGTKAVYRHTIKYENLDEFLNDKIITFNSDFEHAKGIIVNSFKAKVKQAKLEVEKYDRLYTLAKNL